MKILFLVPYPLDRAPSQRFRFEQYFGALIDAGHSYRVQSFLSYDGWKVIYVKGHLIKKILAVAAGLFKRIVAVGDAAGYDFIFIHREAAPFGLPLFEWLIAKVLGKKIIYDFDDAIWLTDRQTESGVAGAIRWRSKVGSICRWSYKVSCGNEYLCAYARQFNHNVVLNPTTIDTAYHRPVQKESSDNITIGWTGTHSTLTYLEDVVPALQYIENKFPEVVFRVISNRAPDLGALRSVRFTPWERGTEIYDLADIDIGIMPLRDDDWAKGKCGFKALQYMAMEIPAVVSPTGVNSVIVQHGTDGLICNSAADWIEALERLIVDPDFRKKIGTAGRKKVEESYSVSSNTSNFLSLFELSAISTRPTR